MNFLPLRPIGRLTVTHQIILLVLAYLTSVAYYYYSWLTTGLLPLPGNHWVLMFAPLYEEVLFRGLILGGLLSLYNKRTAVVLSSFLFGIWHLKNFTAYTPEAMLYQVAYAGLILGPLLAWLTLKTKSIWMGVLVHATNNIFLSPLSWWIVGMCGVKALF